MVGKDLSPFPPAFVAGASPHAPHGGMELTKFRVLYTLLIGKVPQGIDFNQVPIPTFFLPLDAQLGMGIPPYKSWKMFGF